jgi:hypothetical protein
MNIKILDDIKDKIMKKKNCIIIFCSFSLRCIFQLVHDLKVDDENIKFHVKEWIDVDLIEKKSFSPWNVIIIKIQGEDSSIYKKKMSCHKNILFYDINDEKTNKKGSIIIERIKVVPNRFERNLLKASKIRLKNIPDVLLRKENMFTGDNECVTCSSKNDYLFACDDCGHFLCSFCIGYVIDNKECYFCGKSIQKILTNYKYIPSFFEMVSKIIRKSSNEKIIVYTKRDDKKKMSEYLVSVGIKNVTLPVQDSLSENIEDNIRHEYKNKIILLADSNKSIGNEKRICEVIFTDVNRNLILDTKSYGSDIPHISILEL